MIYGARDDETATGVVTPAVAATRDHVSMTFDGYRADNVTDYVLTTASHSNLTFVLTATTAGLPLTIGDRLLFLGRP